MFKDPIVEEIRKFRYEIEDECDNDMEKIYSKGLKIQEKYKSHLISIPFSDRKIEPEKLAA